MIQVEFVKWVSPTQPSAYQALMSIKSGQPGLSVVQVRQELGGRPAPDSVGVPIGELEFRQALIIYASQARQQPPTPAPQPQPQPPPQPQTPKPEPADQPQAC